MTLSFEQCEYLSGLPIDRMLGRRDPWESPTQARDVKRFYNHINATLKGPKRRHRRVLAHFKKMLRKGKWPNARYLSRD